MATTIAAAFAQFKTNLEITDYQTKTISAKQKGVRDAVTADFDVLEDFLTGSYKRSTMIAPLSEADIDIFVVLYSKYYEADGYAELLDSLKATLKKSYPKTPKVSRNGQAVTISFDAFKVDVVPGFRRKGGGFLIPDTYGKQWISTDPKRHIELSTAYNKSHDGDLVPVIKMVKQWNKNISFPFRSFHLEVLAWSLFENVTISNFPSGVRYFFDKARALVRKKNPDPAGYNPDVGSYLDGSNIESAVSNLQTAYDRAVKAEAYAADGEIAKAIDEWRKVFGTSKFPAYG